LVKENNVDIDAATDLKQEPTEETTETTTEETAVPGETPGASADQADAECKEMEALHKKIEELQQANEEYLQSYRRLRADFDNYKRRTRQEMLQAADNGKEELLVQLLPVLDNLERALTATGEPDKWRSGVEMIFRQFLGVLLEAGLKPIPAVGEMFDPNLHEALMREPSEQPENTIVEEIKKGYLFGEKTIRPSLVKVAAASESANGKEKE
jgi:molecular chaperone GrpE